jgi:L-threonylcarbamoyladenylate synthase
MSLITIQQAVEALRRNDVAALPTETVYGLAARIDSEVALQKIFAVKQRPSFDPLIVHVADVSQARALSSEWPEIYDALADKFWPGPLTLIAPKNASVSNVITSGLATVAIRCPMHPLFLEAIALVGKPLAAPSANRFGRTSPTTAEHVETEFDGAVAVVDGGPCTVGVESTVLSGEFTGGKWHLKILRPGGVSRNDLHAFVKERGFPCVMTRESSLASPGNLKEHYQPISPIAILNEKSLSPEVKMQLEKKLKRKFKSESELKLPRTAQAAARMLYSEFRKLSRDENHLIWVTRPNSINEDWEAIWDRLDRASSVIL